MPQFLTISPTHIAGKKEYAWNKFKSGGYIAIGWMPQEDLSGKHIDEIVEIIQEHNFDDQASAIGAFRKFLSLAIGDWVAVNNAVHGLFGVGVVTSGYYFEKWKHDSGAEDEEFYSHLIDVDWKRTSYVRRQSILDEGETGWPPYGTVGAMLPKVPVYIRRLLGEPPPPPVGPPEYLRPDWLVSVIQSVEALRSDSKHQERAHESLVEDFFCALGHAKHRAIKYRQGRVDITICAEDTPILLVEVKRDWDLGLQKSRGEILQAYGYALDQGVRYVLLTNGDYYLLFDRLKGLSIESNAVGEFQLTALEEADLGTIDRLKPERLRQPDLAELFRHLSEGFE